MPFRIAFLGFSEFERSALGSYFRLAGDRSPSYTLVATLTDADFLVADADHAASVQLVLATERTRETVFIGSHAPPDCPAWMARPIDALHVMRELDAMVLMRDGAADSAEGRPASAEEAPLELPADLGAHLRPVMPGPIPVPAPAPRHVRPGRPAAAPASTTPATPLPRALIVDDSELALRFLRTRLQPWGLAIDSAASSGPALELLAAHSYDLVFLDVELGSGSEVDGLTLCRQIKESPAGMTAFIVMVSAHHSELDRVRGALAGCDAYLAKPLDPEELQVLLRRNGLQARQAEGTEPA